MFLLESMKVVVEMFVKFWYIVLCDVQLCGYKVYLVDCQLVIEVLLEVGLLDFDLQNVDSFGKIFFDFKFKIGFGNCGQVQVSGQVVFDLVSVRFKVSICDIDLCVVQVYILLFICLELCSGFFGSELVVDLKSVELLVFSVDGSVEVSQLYILDIIKDCDFVKWIKLIFNGFVYWYEDSLLIQSVFFEEFYVCFIINEDCSINVSELIIL